MQVPVKFASLDIDRATLDDVAYELTVAHAAAMEAIENLEDINGQFTTIRRRFAVPAQEAEFADRLSALLPALLALKGPASSNKLNEIRLLACPRRDPAAESECAECRECGREFCRTHGGV